ncbi:hypothetical protein DERP_008256 [Dermatophagoides pteronyssinus]|uniref:Uncharacterized protein n=1 Tax=Dermatophagoides pteronyssinus TaxID=6956 RepID=A0ABQ8J6M1_DERPT|nr:hypothetical protein DERP_008256 [Dermatophagoides pteronyssinus]
MEDDANNVKKFIKSSTNQTSLSLAEKEKGEQQRKKLHLTSLEGSEKKKKLLNMEQNHHNLKIQIAKLFSAKVNLSKLNQQQQQQQRNETTLMIKMAIRNHSFIHSQEEKDEEEKDH